MRPRVAHPGGLCFQGRHRNDHHKSTPSSSSSSSSSSSTRPHSALPGGKTGAQNVDEHDFENSSARPVHRSGHIDRWIVRWFGQSGEGTWSSGFRERARQGLFFYNHCCYDSIEMNLYIPRTQAMRPLTAAASASASTPRNRSWMDGWMDGFKHDYALHLLLASWPSSRLSTSI